MEVKTLSHGNDTSCVITGSSVHNERVERLWRDVHRCILIMFGDLFRCLEQEELLNPLICSVYTSSSYHALIVEFRESWNHHKHSSEGNRSPYQLHIEVVAAQIR